MLCGHFGVSKKPKTPGESLTEASGIRVVLRMDVPGSNRENLTKVLHFSYLRNTLESSFKSKIVIE